MRYFKIILHLRKVNFFLLLPETHPYYLLCAWQVEILLNSFTEGLHLMTSPPSVKEILQRLSPICYLFFFHKTWLWLTDLQLIKEPKPNRKMLIVYAFTFGLSVRLREKTYHNLKCPFCLHCFL